MRTKIVHLFKWLFFANINKIYTQTHTKAINCKNKSKTTRDSALNLQNLCQILHARMHSKENKFLWFNKEKLVIFTK